MKKMPTSPRREQEKGITLVVALIMLVLVTLLVVTSLNLGKGSLQAVGNMQHQNQTLSAAQESLEEVISSKRFFETPTSVFPNPCDGKPNTRCVDINADNIPDVSVTLTPAPSCVQAQAIKNTNLDLANSEDVGCSVGTVQNFGVGMPGTSSGDSLCAESLWNIRAEAVDKVSETKVVATQGVSVRVSNDNVATSCP
jgi:Tfp pilus assembly protein PilX